MTTETAIALNGTHPGALVHGPREATSPETAPLTAADIKSQVQLIQQVMQAVMQEGHHYGVIPGTEKPTLLKPGAEKLTMTFRLAPSLHVEQKDLGNGHREYLVRCILTHIPTGKCYGEGVGSCSTLEARYRYRQAARTCPHCARETIIKGKAEYGGGWLCFQKKGGCGAKFSDTDTSITSQPTGRVENEDLPDTYNTVLKMARKRALVDATLTATAASDCFTQDLEDFLPAPAVTSGPPVTVAPTPPLSPVEMKREAPSSALVGDRIITRGQHEILMQLQRKSRVQAAEFMRHLRDVFNINAVAQLKQKDLNDVLEWLEEQQATRTEEEVAA